MSIITKSIKSSSSHVITSSSQVIVITSHHKSSHVAQPHVSLAHVFVSLVTHSFWCLAPSLVKVMPAMSPVYTNPYNVVCPVCSCRTTTILWTFVSHDCFVAMFYHCSECCWRLYHVDFESHRLLNPHIPLPTLDSSEQRDSAWTE